MNSTEINKKRISFLTRFSILLAIEAIVCFTPLGSLPAIGPIVATLGMIPVVITAILLGTRAGTLMGFCAGLFSFMVWTFMPPSPIAFVFTPFYSIGEVSGNFYSLIICFVPRILVGTVTGLSCMLLSGVFRKNTADRSGAGAWIYAVSGCLGSLTNTFLVLGGIILFFGSNYAGVIGVAYDVMLGMVGLTILTSGIPEALLSAVAAYFVCRAVKL